MKLGHIDNKYIGGQALISKIDNVVRTVADILGSNAGDVYYVLEDMEGHTSIIPESYLEEYHPTEEAKLEQRILKIEKHLENLTERVATLNERMDFMKERVEDNLEKVND